MLQTPFLETKKGRTFIEAAQKSKKPIIALKSGVSAHGAAAAASHTGSLAGAAKVYGSAFRQAGVIQAADLNDLFNRTQALSLQPPMKSENLLIVTNGGGVGVLATDAAERYGIPLHFAPQDVQDELKKHMPEFGSAKNPVDLTGMAGNEWYYEEYGPGRGVRGLGLNDPWPGATPSENAAAGQEGEAAAPAPEGEDRRSILDLFRN